MTGVPNLRGGDPARALLEGLVDYAGLFPPAALPMADAAARYAEYRRGNDAWALGTFVVPVARLSEFEKTAGPQLVDGDPWPLSLLTSTDFGADAALIRAFAARASARAIVRAAETKASTVPEIAAVARGAALLRSALPTPFETYVEVPIALDPSALIDAIAAHGLRAKVRTGGLEPAAFPAASQLARFIERCVVRNVAFKATAGLHHAIRGSYPFTYDAGSERGIMFGFLNVFLAVLFAREGLRPEDTSALLEERDAGAFTFTPAGIAWRGHEVGTAAVRAARARSGASFGSCSFTEPVAELAGLGLL